VIRLHYETRSEISHSLCFVWLEENTMRFMSDTFSYIKTKNISYLLLIPAFDYFLCKYCFILTLEKKTDEIIMATIAIQKQPKEEVRAWLRNVRSL